MQAPPRTLAPARVGIRLPTLAALGALVACSPTPPAGIATPAPAASVAAVQVSDTDVTEHVKTALRRDEVLKAYDIGVVTTKGDVRLIGTLNQQAHIDKALQLARAAEGAHSIHDELILKP